MTPLGNPKWTACNVRLPTRLGGAAGGSSIVSDVGNFVTSTSAALLDAIGIDGDSVSGGKGGMLAVCAVTVSFSNHAAKVTVMVYHAVNALLLS